MCWQFEEEVFNVNNYSQMPSGKMWQLIYANYLLTTEHLSTGLRVRKQSFQFTYELFGLWTNRLITLKQNFSTSQFLEQIKCFAKHNELSPASAHVRNYYCLFLQTYLKFSTAFMYLFSLLTFPNQINMT